jgi:hypothetical protein
MSTFDLAMKFHQLSRNEDLHRIEMFAVKLSDGRIGYCNILAGENDCYGLCVYIGKEGLESLLTTLRYKPEQDEIEDADNTFYLHAQECLVCQFEDINTITEEEKDQILRYFYKRGIDVADSYYVPCLNSTRVRRIPYPVNRDEEEDLIKALMAANYVIEHKNDFTCLDYEKSWNGLIRWGGIVPLLTKEGRIWNREETKVPVPSPDPFIYPALPDPAILDFILRKKQNPKSTVEITFRVPAIYVWEGVSEQDPAPYCPVAMLVMQEGAILDMILNRGLTQEDHNDMIQQVAEQLADLRERPGSIYTDGKFGYKALKKFCDAVQIDLVLKDEIPWLKEAYRKIVENMKEPHDLLKDALDVVEETPAFQSLMEKYGEGLSQEEKDELKLNLLIQMMSGEIK